VAFNLLILTITRAARARGFRFDGEDSFAAACHRSTSGNEAIKGARTALST
jgi:hypothetical protein